LKTRAAPAFVITCEHAVNRIPPRYRKHFAGQQAMLQSHHGYDRGALTMAQDLARRFDAPLFHADVSRLLVDLNRSPWHTRLHGSDAIRRLPPDERRKIRDACYAPFRAAAELSIARTIARRRRVIHISSHSFTPVLAGIVRNADVGLLYDPSRREEARLCRDWQAALRRRATNLRIRRNYPYTGKSDGFTAFLRRRFPDPDYVGIELEINQAIVLKGGRAWSQLRAVLIDGLADALRIGA
jgi:predicted N-formylglutamate amidohydrolase